MSSKADLPRCAATQCRAKVGRADKKFCDRCWSLLPLHLRTDLYEAVIKGIGAHKALRICIANLETQKGVKK